MKENLFRDIIVKFLKGHATGHEKRMLADWLKEDPAREEIFYYHLSILESENPQHLPDIDSSLAAYERYLLGQVETPTANFPDTATNDPVKRRPLNYRWLAAASLLLLICAALYFILQNSFLYKTYVAGRGNIKTVHLDDGSIVTLNANSSITVLRDFMTHEQREVWINGEAFFEVTKKNDAMKFIVHTTNFDVEVLGTKFNVNDRGGKTEVILAEGKVKLLGKDREPLIMKPGEQISMSRSDDQFEKQVVKPEKYTAWRNNVLVFDNTPLAEVVQIVEDYYGVEIQLQDSLLARRDFTGTLPNNDIDVILLALSTAYKIEVERKGDRTILKSKNIN